MSQAELMRIPAFLSVEVSVKKTIQTKLDLERECDAPQHFSTARQLHNRPLGLAKYCELRWGM